MNRSLFAFLIVAISWRSLQALPNPIPVRNPNPIPVPQNPNPIPVPQNPKPIPVPPIVDQLCKRSVKEQACIAAVQADPRENLKSTPEGVVTILVEAAKTNIKDTTKFLKKAIPTVKEPTALQQMKDCLQAYNSIKPEFKVNLKKLGTPDGKADAEQVINSMEMELSYDCSWEEVQSRPPPMLEMTARVNSFSDVLIAAAAILSDVPSV